MVRLSQSSKNDSVAILGSGFGYYGYLKTILKFSKFKIIIQKNRADKIGNIFNKKSIKLESYGNIIKLSKYVIIAKRPVDQRKIIQDLIQINKNKVLFLEKPLCENPKKSLKILRSLIKNNIPFKINYIFLYTNWFKQLKRTSLGENTKLSLKWNFTNKDINSWKFKKIYGGGIIRYYGIQIIAVTSVLGFNKCIKSKVKKNKDKVYNWTAIFIDNKNNSFEVFFDLNNNIKNNFQILKNNHLKIEMNNPFTNKRNNYNYDNRIIFLKKHLYHKTNINEKKHINIINLWKEVEHKNIDIYA